jgi:4-alpha-glucanotransferase
MDQRQLPADAYPEAALVSIATHDLPTLAGFWAGRDIEVRQEIGDLESERAEAFRVERAQHKERIIERLVEDGHLKPDEGETALQSALPTDALHTAVLAFLLRTRCHLVMINQEDVFLDGRQQNFPGTTWQHPNWVTKMKYSIEELTRDPEALRLAGKVKKLVEEAGRSA